MNLYCIKNQSRIHTSSRTWWVVAKSISDALALMPRTTCPDTQYEEDLIVASMELIVGADSNRFATLITPDGVVSGRA